MPEVIIMPFALVELFATAIVTVIVLSRRKRRTCRKPSGDLRLPPKRGVVIVPKQKPEIDTP